MSKMQNMSNDQIIKAIATYKAKLPLIPEGEDKDLCLVGLENFQNELQRRAQKKTEAQPAEKPEQLEAKKDFFQKQAEEYRQAGHERLAQKVEEDVQNMHHDQIETSKSFDQKIEWEQRDGYNTTYTQPQPKVSSSIKTVKAPDFEETSELINVTLTNQKGQEYVRQHTKGQVKALCRKYFANVLESWSNGNKKMGIGFKNLLAYFVAWTELEQMPELDKVLLHYSKYKKEQTKGETEVLRLNQAKELYAKIVEILNRPK